MLDINVRRGTYNNKRKIFGGLTKTLDFTWTG